MDGMNLDSMISQSLVPPPMPDDTKMHFGISFLINLPLYKHKGNSVMIKIMNGLEDITPMFFPRMRLIPFRNISGESIPAELYAERTTSAELSAHARPFNPNLLDSANNFLTTIDKTAAQCVKLATQIYEQFGYKTLHSLTGVESYQAAQEILFSVLPLNNPKIFPPKTTMLFGEKFTSPFVKDVLEYLQQDLSKELNVAAEKHGEELIGKLYRELLDGAKKANTIARDRINDSERQMTTVPQEKKGYDMRSALFENDDEPFDLVCLAHLEEKPKSERQLEQARQLQEEQNRPLNELGGQIGRLVDLAIGKNQSPDMEAEIERRVQERLAAMDNAPVGRNVNGRFTKKEAA